MDYKISSNAKHIKSKCKKCTNPSYKYLGVKSKLAILNYIFDKMKKPTMLLEKLKQFLPINAYDNLNDYLSRQKLISREALFLSI